MSVDSMKKVIEKYGKMLHNKAHGGSLQLGPANSVDLSDANGIFQNEFKALVIQIAQAYTAEKHARIACDRA